MNQASSHLTDRQISDYVQDSTTGPAAQQLEAHLANCESCLDRLLHAERIHLGLLEGNGMKRTPYLGCPPEEALQELAAGICASDTAQTTTEHAAHCNYCGPLLNRYLKEFSEDVQPEDAAVLRELKTSMPGWQKNFIRENLRSEKQEPQGWFTFWPRLLTASAVGVAAAVAAFVSFRPNDLEKAQQLVASAYSERRTTEMRFPSAPHASFNPVPIVKGPADGGDWKSAPASLVEAEAVLKKKDGASDLSPQWLQVEGRIDLLEGSSKSIEQAVEVFEKALAKAPDDQGLKIDLATAYFEREMRADQDRPVLIRTIDLLNDVIKNSKPEDSQLRIAALFDLAIAYEKSEMLDLAVSTWQQYLQLDGASDWATEARKHLEILEKAIPPPKAQGYAEPSYFLAHSSDPQVASAIEEYQDIAMRTWLPVAIQDRSSESARAVARLAELLKQRHSDPWLQDFINHTTPADLPAVKNLAEASAYDLNDLHRQAIVKSHNAVSIFAGHNNGPGELRARYQEIYGLQRSLAADQCLEQAEKLWVPLSRTRYHWLQAQLALEKATCANRTLDFDTAAANISTSRQIAQQFHLSELMLRVAGFDAGIQQWQQNYYEGWKRAVRGLALYWRRGCPATDDGAQSLQGARDACPRSGERLYQFYSVMQQCARKLGLPHASEVLLVQSMLILENSAPNDISLRAILHLRLANTLLGQNNPALAEAEASKAEYLLTQIPQHEGTAQIYTAATRIELSDFELKLGNATSALSEIEPLQASINNQDDFIRFDFYTIKGDVLHQLRRFDDSLDAYGSGLRIAESPLSGLKDNALRLNWALAAGRAYRGLTRALLALGRNRDALSVWERFQGRSLEEASTADERAQGGENAGFYRTLPATSEPHLIYASFEDGLQIWVAIGSQVHSSWVPVKQEELRRQVNEFAKQCANPSLSPDKSQALYSLILQPVIADLGPSSTVAIELDEPLLGLSFEALRNNTGHYFADDHTVVYSPGLLAEETLRQPTRLSLQDPMLLVDASRSVDGGPLPSHWEEVNAVKRAFVNTKTLGPSEITSAEIRQALAQSSEFHFSGHGKLEGTGTALVISSHLLLGANDLRPRELRHIRLAVLSACESGSSKKGTFDQSNLVRAFLSAGVPTVIASRWDVDSRSTAHFMQSFYSRLQTGASASEALEHAQAEMRSAQSHPYYWAAFALTGRVN